LRDNIAAEETAVRVRNLTKKFGDFFAVDDISFDVEKGEIFGFLGPNGAGKSTTIRILCGIIAPTSGEGYVAGRSILKNRDEIKQTTGYMSQKFSLYEELTPFENLEFYGGVYGLDSNSRKARVDWALEMSGLSERRDDLTSELPIGYKQRLALGASLLHKPSILFLDEPTAGVDPLSRRSFWDLIYELSKSGVTVFVTTHYMDEAEHCDRIAFINSGKLIKLDTPHELKKIDSTSNIIEIEAENWLRAFNILRTGAAALGEVSLFGTRIHLNLIGREIKTVEKFLSDNNVEIKSLRQVPPSLEDVFVALLKPRISEEVSP
jgi:ABC-2 type transport system ATP-binding protein